MQEREKAIPLQPLSGERAQVTENDMLKNSVLDPASGCASILPWYCPRERESHPSGFPEKTFSKKTSEKFGRIKKSIYLCIRFPIKTEAEKKRDL